MKVLFDKNAPTFNLVTTISGVIALIISILAMAGVFTPEQAAGVTDATDKLMVLIPEVISAIAGLILVFKAKDT